MRYFLSLGSNQGERIEHLIKAINEIAKQSQIINVSSLFENPPLLPPQAPSEWYHFFLNACLEIESHLSPQELLAELKLIEQNLGRSKDYQKWSPRPIDIDILFTSPTTNLQTNEISLPHPQYKKRNFVLTPLQHLYSQQLPAELMTIYKTSQPLSALMAIINVTPDSFSETSGKIDYPSIFSKIKNYFNRGVQYIDIGAESTRPGAQILTAEEEWQRLQPVLEYIKDLKAHSPFSKISLDTYHYQTALKACDYPVDILNDVNGLKDPALLDVAQNYNATILMHSLCVPADKNINLADNVNVIEHLKEWIEQRLEQLPTNLSNKIIFDPGIGFGKTPLQSLNIIQNIKQLTCLPIKTLVGHSRKSFMSLWCDRDYKDRDTETLAISLYLKNQGVDILRVHNIESHQQALNAELAGRSL